MSCALVERPCRASRSHASVCMRVWGLPVGHCAATVEADELEPVEGIWFSRSLWYSVTAPPVSGRARSRRITVRGRGASTFHWSLLAYAEPRTPPLLLSVAPVGVGCCSWFSVVAPAVLSVAPLCPCLATLLPSSAPHPTHPSHCLPSCPPAPPTSTRCWRCTSRATPWRPWFTSLATTTAQQAAPCSRPA